FGDVVPEFIAQESSQRRCSTTQIPALDDHILMPQLEQRANRSRLGRFLGYDVYRAQLDDRLVGRVQRSILRGAWSVGKPTAPKQQSERAQYCGDGPNPGHPHYGPSVRAVALRSMADKLVNLWLSRHISTVTESDRLMRSPAPEILSRIRGIGPE